MTKLENTQLIPSLSDFEDTYPIRKPIQSNRNIARKDGRGIDVDRASAIHMRKYRKWVDARDAAYFELVAPMFAAGLPAAMETVTAYVGLLGRKEYEANGNNPTDQAAGKALLLRYGWTETPEGKFTSPAKCGDVVSAADSLPTVATDSSAQTS